MKNLSILSALTIVIVLVSCNEKSSNDNSTKSLLLYSPLVLSTVPANGAINVVDNSSIVVTFSQTINQATVTPTTFNFTPAISGTYITVGPVVSFTPTAPGFQTGLTYIVTIPADGITGTNGFPVILQYQFSFTAL